MPRIPVGWLIVFVVLATIAFFGYHIYSVSNTPSSTPMSFEGELNVFHPQASNRAAPLAMEIETPITEPMIDPLPMPEVVGQTEEDLRETRPIQQTPPDAIYPDPEPVDQTEGAVHSESEFGDNLRHPEQTVEVAPPLGTLRMVQSGVGSEEPTPTCAGKHDPTVYSPEMAQNGGEFMSGIWAYDGGDSSVGFSTI
jgi:hypothetical protein